MRQVLWVAQREFLELRRQPGLWISSGLVYALIAGLVLSLLLLLQVLSGDPEATSLFQQNLETAGMGFEGYDSLARSVVGVMNFLSLTQLLGMTAVIAGHSMLHDRQVHTLPFLLLAPLKRWQLLAGKVLGSLSAPVLLYALVGGGMAAVAASLSVTSGAAPELPGGGSWALSFLLAGPSWAAVIGLVCALLSSLARDVRGAQQAVWLVVFVATFTVGALVAGTLALGPVVQALLAGLGLATVAMVLALGQLIVSRDLSR